MVSRKTKKALASFVSLVVVVVLLAIFQGAIPVDDKMGEFEQAVVVRVVDGDTLVVDRGRGEEKLRLIGVDCPESVNPDKSKNTEEGRAASDFTKSVVSGGRSVWLQKDISDTDRYGRLLRYVWLEEPTLGKDPEEVATKMLNGLLVSQGHAVVKEYRPDTAYSSIFEGIAQRH